MRKVYYFILTLILGIGISNAAVRDEKSPTRGSSPKVTISRTGTTSVANTSRQIAPRTVTRTAVSAAASKKQNTIARTATNNRVVRAATARTATTGNARTATTPRNNIMNAQSGRAARSATAARSTISLSAHDSVTFGTGYNTCRDAYFTCMDQFCTTANDTYRRCICSSKLPEIQSRERALSQASDQLQDFVNLNLSVIDKSAAEVNAMISASVGELTQSTTKDKSDSAAKLSGISDVLSKTKKQSLSTQGTLDIAGNINEIWSTTDLAGGANIANLTGEALYNAVHAQCSAMVVDKCPSPETQTMVVSAYGMYIENDCSILINNLDKQLTNANSGIRDTERNMNIARLETYNAHNSSTIHDCIAQVRQDITADTACGPDYIHCLDITGLYLNIETGEPIYGPNFYQLTSQISLSGDVLTNQSNRLLVTELNRKRIFAERGLDTCRDIANEVWDEFLRQAISEIYQGQQDRIRQVKKDCLDVVNNCYDAQRQSLKDFSNTDEQLLLGAQMELSEEMCREKLDACSNLYGGGPNGFAELLNAMKNITTQQIANECVAALQDFANDLCIPSASDSIHQYPYACRMYAPGEQKYAQITICNDITKNESTTNTLGISGGSDDVPDSTTTPPYPAYICPTEHRRYTGCKKGHYLDKNKNKCYTCPDGCTCDGKDSSPRCGNTNKLEYGACGPDYVGSLYHKLVRHARQACARPSENTNELPATVMQDVNVVMDKIRKSMAESLSAECERWNGIWVNTIWIDTTTDCSTLRGIDESSTQELQAACETANKDSRGNPDLKHDHTGHTQNKAFYDETGANTKWGFCATAPSLTDNTSQTGGGSGSGSGGSSGGGSDDSNPICKEEDCGASTSVTVTLDNTALADPTKGGCCPGGANAVAPKTDEIIETTCPAYTQWPVDDEGNKKEHAKCTTNPKCIITSYKTAEGYYHYNEGADSTTPLCKNTTVYAIWEEQTTE